MVLDSCLNSSLVESLLPKIDSSEEYFTLPNGVCYLGSIPKTFMMIQRDLSDATPRLVTSIMIAHLNQPPNSQNVLKYLKHEISKLFK